jgi:hypothetical protein
MIVGQTRQGKRHEYTPGYKGRGTRKAPPFIPHGSELFEMERTSDQDCPRNDCFSIASVFLHIPADAGDKNDAPVGIDIEPLIVVF